MLLSALIGMAVAMLLFVVVAGFIQVWREWKELGRDNDGSRPKN